MLNILALYLQVKKEAVSRSIRPKQLGIFLNLVPLGASEDFKEPDENFKGFYRNQYASLGLSGSASWVKWVYDISFYR